MNTSATLRPLLDAKSVAIVGAVPARDHGKLASKPILNLQRYGFRGSIYPVNPKFDSIAGLTSYQSLSDLPEAVDCVMMLRNADYALPTLHEMVEREIPAAVVCSSGFAEIGGDGAERQRELSESARAAQIVLCGPNTNGLLNFRNGMMLGFHPLLEQERLVRAGSVSVVSHSGTVTGAIMARLQAADVGFGYVISAGNEAIVQAADYMEYIAADDDTRVVVLYLEQVRDADRFLASCEALQRAGKTVLALKAGASKAGAEVAFGHTGALVGSHEAFRAAAEARGVIICEGLEDLVALTKMAATSAAAPSSSIIGLSMSGGLNGLMADAADRGSVPFEPLTEATIGRLREIVPISSPTNPFDLTGLAVDRPGVLDQVLDALADGTSAKEYVFSLGLMPDTTWPEWSRVCSEFASRRGVRMSVYAASGRREGDGYGFFERAGIPVYESIDPLMRSLRAFSAAAARPATQLRVVPAADKRIPDDVPGRRELLTEWGLNYIPYSFVTDPDAAVRSSSEMGYPVAMKVASEAIAHKAKYGLIALDVHSEDEARRAYERLSDNFEALRDTMPNLGTLRVETQKMLPRGGMEVFIGAKVDPDFGVTVSAGLGGGLVEAIADLSSAQAPLDEVRARHLLESNPILGRALAGGKWDVEALVSTLVRFSEMASAMAGQLDEVECNPVVVSSEGAWVVDDLWLTRSDGETP
ncbi:pimeloyl-CoA synthetase [Agrococcus baldri]|uniref:Pimeloyl-CoA synthetase n=2 Tax=Agrococcus baldri TaxID=153730 RepID=A0AA87RA72_9MICO|nr:pimeloyl-CoA synthetase [Agrococcus baldri]